MFGPDSRATPTDLAAKAAALSPLEASSLDPGPSNREIKRPPNPSQRPLPPARTGTSTDFLCQVLGVAYLAIRYAAKNEGQR
jgi:hypothetical protein